MPSTPSTPPITPPTAVPTTAPTGPAILLPSLKPCAAPPGTPCACAERGSASEAKIAHANTDCRFIVVHLLTLGGARGLAGNEGHKVTNSRQCSKAIPALRDRNGSVALEFRE